MKTNLSSLSLQSKLQEMALLLFTSYQIKKLDEFMKILLKVSNICDKKLYKFENICRLRIFSQIKIYSRFLILTEFNPVMVEKF